MQRGHLHNYFIAYHLRTKARRELCGQTKGQRRPQDVTVGEVASTSVLIVFWHMGIEFPLKRLKVDEMALPKTSTRGVLEASLHLSKTVQGLSCIVLTMFAQSFSLVS